MKMIIFFLSLCVIIHGKNIKYNELKNKSGVYYEVNSKIPYTGMVTTYNENQSPNVEISFKEGKEEKTTVFVYNNKKLVQQHIYTKGKLKIIYMIKK